jgi:hypothetical protein
MNLFVLSTTAPPHSCRRPSATSWPDSHLFDGWSSANLHALYGIACFFRDEHNKPCKILLGVPEVSVRHSGSIIAAQVLDILTAYRITDKIGYFTFDNAENNDIAISEVNSAKYRIRYFFNSTLHCIV